MASSSSVPTSTSQSWNYDVFLTFRGEDTRKRFVDHLYTALVQKGIHTYKDNETLAQGESIGPSLMKAIQESRIALIIFSKNYASSSWCLDELAYIIECMENRGQIVMPVFYDVDPSYVRKQKGKYGEAFVKYEGQKKYKIKIWRRHKVTCGEASSEHECENKHKIKVWREALVKASNLSGWVLKDFANGHEAKCIEDIVGTISNSVSQRTTNINKDFIGMEARLQDLKSKLDIASGGVRIVGIWGVGGGGKTTLASAAYMEISHQFEARCFLENIREESDKHGLKSLQEKFLSLVLKTNVVVGSEMEGRSMLKRRLCHKSVLVVLDDVDDLKQIKALVGSHEWFGEGSRIIITTRDEHLLTRKVDMICEVSLLSHDEAIELFNMHAYRKDKPIEDYEMLSQELVSYAGGLPLALEVLGSFLYDKDKHEWRSTLAKLKCMPDAKVTERLKISYDGLEPHEKELFLDIACYMKGWSTDKGIMVLDACGFHPSIGVKVLVQKSLIKVSSNKFSMHDLIEEMAHYIVRGPHPSCPAKYSRIWKYEDFEDLCAMEAGTLMENEVLYNLSSSDSFSPRYQDVVANMKKLRWIKWECYPASSFLSDLQPKLLLPNLKILGLENAKYLTRTPDFNGLPNLERLCLKHCVKLESIHPSIGYHERLVLVNMMGCFALKTFPPIVCMKKLQTLDLSYCSGLQKFPDIQSNMYSLVNLHLDHTDIEIIPSSVGQFCYNLVSFDLRNCKNLKRIEGNFRLLDSLKHLNVYGCYQLEKFADDFFDRECFLEVLSLSINNQKSQDSTSLIVNLMDRIGLQSSHQGSLGVSPKLPLFPIFLKKLVLSDCQLGDGDIPSDISNQLLNLQVLDLSGNNFSRLHSILSGIPCLKLLNLSNCISLFELPDLPTSIAILEAEGCYSLQRLGDLSKCTLLWKVELFRNFNKFIDGKRVLHSLLQVNANEERFMRVKFPVLDADQWQWLQLQSKSRKKEFALDQWVQRHYMSGNTVFDADEWQQLQGCINENVVFSMDQHVQQLYTSGHTVLDEDIGASKHSDFSYFGLESHLVSPVRQPLESLDNCEWEYEEYSDSTPTKKIITLQLPHNWYSDFSGFLLCGFGIVDTIVIKQEMSTDSQPDNDYWEEFDKDLESYEHMYVGYVPFSSLRHTTWWNPTYSRISFDMGYNSESAKVGLVPKKSESSDSRETTIYSSECWEERGSNKTFKIIDDFKSSSIQIEWQG